LRNGPSLRPLDHSPLTLLTDSRVSSRCLPAARGRSSALIGSRTARGSCCDPPVIGSAGHALGTCRRLLTAAAVIPSRSGRRTCAACCVVASTFAKTNISLPGSCSPLAAVATLCYSAGVRDPALPGGTATAGVTPITGRCRYTGLTIAIARAAISFAQAEVQAAVISAAGAGTTAGLCNATWRIVSVANPVRIRSRTATLSRTPVITIAMVIL
jgi:hypothetical protein